MASSDEGNEAVSGAKPVPVPGLRLVGAPGTNKIMAGELSRLVRRGQSAHRLAAPIKQGTGSLVYPWSAEVARIAVCYHRTSTRVLWDVAASRAPRLEPLYDDLLAQLGAADTDWAWDGATISVRARNVGAFAAGERQVVGVVKNAVIDAARTRGVALTVAPDDADVLIAARMHDDRFTVSVDLAGRSMNQRGYRRETGPAPLRETLAAAIIMLARYDARSEILLDPMTGSGTIAIEAALMARASPVWVPPRQPALVRLPALADVAARSTPPLFADTAPSVVAGEIDPGAVAAARTNAAAAGVTGDIAVVPGDFRDLERDQVIAIAPGPQRDGAGGVIVCNPPYGGRMGGDDLLDLYRDLGQWIEGFRGWRAAFLVANEDFESALGRRPRIKKPLSSRPFRGYFYLYDL